MNSWRPYPLLRTVIPFMAGIIAEIVTGFPGFWFPALMCGLLLVSQVLPLALNNYRLRWITGLIFNLLFLLAGYEIAFYHRPENDPDFIGTFPEGLFIATIAEPPVVSVAGIKAMLHVRFCCEHGTWVRRTGKVLGYLKFRTGNAGVQYGDQILLRAIFTEISDNSNPHSFNYAVYLQNKGVTHRVYAAPWCWKPINIESSGYIRNVAFQVRDRLLDILRHNHVEGREFAVAAALLLGYVDDLDADLRRDYAATGAMHILSVSGMHVGIIYIFLEFLLGFLNRTKPGRFFKAVLLLIFIWFYALVTGLSPCVLRSAAMLSLPILGKSLNRSPDMYNIISASIILILALDPFLLTDVGFQLSYLAVTGIILLYKPIYDLFVTSAWLVDKIWSILAVSIAAQVATLPITLYTFHQFPNYFMVTNLFVVPLSSLIIYDGILLLVAGYMPVISLFSAKLFIFLIWLLNTIIHFIEQLPCSTIRGIFISGAGMILLYIIIGALFLFFTLRRISFFFVFLGTAAILGSLILDGRIQRLRSAGIIVFNSSHESLCLFRSQDKAVIFYKAETTGNMKSGRPNHALTVSAMQALGIKFCREYWLGQLNRKPDYLTNYFPMKISGNFILFSDHRIAFVMSSFPRGFNHQIDVDIVIISGNPGIKISDISRIYHPSQIIIDATNPRFKTLKWMKEADNLGIHSHAVTVNGAFQKEF
jgi:competence protein ComEC